VALVEKGDTMRRLLGIAIGLLAAGACAAFALPAAQAHPGPDAHEPGTTAAGLPPETPALLREVRDATRAYRDVEAAEEAGYVAASPCEDDPKYGGMGIHYAHPGLVADGVLDPLRPEILVYQPTASGRLRLGAVEYFQVDADQDLATDPDRPSLFGMPFDGPMLGHSLQMPIHYDLHVWLYRHNPAGLFAMWNPRVHCPSNELEQEVADVR
jgi:hypothetical protein